MADKCLCHAYFEGVYDKQIKQGQDFDLAQGVRAIDGYGNEVDFTYEPTEIDLCKTGDQEVTYKAFGASFNVIPKLCMPKYKKGVSIPEACPSDLEMITAKRIIRIIRASNPRFLGIPRVTITENEAFDPTEGVTAVDDNDNTIDFSYEGKYDLVAEGDDITTFETEYAQNAKAVEVALEPIQDGTPRIDSTLHTNPYTLQQIPSGDYNTEMLESVVGGTVAWNQQVKTLRSVGTVSGVTFTNNNGTVTLSGTATSNISVEIVSSKSWQPHKYFVSGCPKGGSRTTYAMRMLGQGTDTVDVGNGAIWNATGNQWKGVTIAVNSGVNTNNLVFKPMVIDLTQMFGTTIADYIYNLEQTTEGAGVAWFKALFPNDYYPYDAGTLKSVQTSGHKMTDANEQGITYPLDADLTLRGIPKLDASNNLYYDGDVYKSSGSVTRKYGVVDLGTLTWTYIPTQTRFYAIVSNAKFPSGDYSIKANIVCAKYTTVNFNEIQDGQHDKAIAAVTTSFNAVSIRDTAYTDASALKASLNGVMLVYELADPTTESADPYTMSQTIYDGGAEEFVGAEIPVGHQSRYALVCPISGHTEVVTQRTGINVWDEEWENGRYKFTTGETSSGNGVRSKNKIKVLPNTAYHIVFGDYGASNIAALYYDADENYISYENKYSATRNVNITTPSDAYYMCFNVQTSSAVTTYNHDISINYPSTDHDYHAYDGHTYTTTLGRTVYGGTLDVVSGELVVDRAIVDIGDLVWNGTPPNFYTTRLNPVYQWASDIGLMCTKYANEGYSSASPWYGSNGSIKHYYYRGQQPLGEFYIRDESFTTSASFTEGNRGQKIVYKLANTQTIQLTPQQVELLKGTNNVWSEEGNVRVIYEGNIPQDGSFEYPLEGNYTITYKATDKCGNEGTAERTIVVTPSE